MTQSVASEMGVGTVLRETYEITSLLGKGGMGAVYLARHRRLPGKQVAVKVLLNSAGLNPELYARFRREAEIASQLGHPNIVEVSDFDTLQDGTPFLVMEYLRGESLEHRLARGPMSLPDTLGLVRQIGSALQAAHRAGVVHRDLKPANVFLVPTDSEGLMGERVKLLDFGISKMLDSRTLQTQEAVLIGTPQYMAPEQAMGKNSEVGPRTDLFALGCIVYEMLSGRPPFAAEGSSLVQVIFRVVHAQPEPLGTLCPELPRQVIEAVEQALAKSPQDRPSDVSSFIAALTGTPLATATGTMSGPLRPPMRPSGSSGTAQFGAPAAGAPDDGLGATHMPSSTARFAAPVAGAPDDGLGATHMPSSTARFAAPAAGALDDGLGATHMPASTARMAPMSIAPPPPASPGLSTPAPVAPAPPAAPVPAAPVPLVPAPAVPPAVPRRSFSWVGPAAGLGVLVLLFAGVQSWRHFHPLPSQVQGEPMVEPKQVPVAQTSKPPETVTTTPVTPPPQGVTPSSGESAVTQPPVPTPPVATHPTAHPSTGPEKAGPPESEEALQASLEAEAALKQGESGSAIRIANRALRTAPTSSSAYSVLTRAYCNARDLSNANASWRKGQGYMSSKARAQVQADCKRSGIELLK